MICPIVSQNDVLRPISPLGAHRLPEEGLSQRFLAIFFLVGISTFYCSLVLFTALLNHLLKEEGLSHNVPAIFLVEIDAYYCFCYTFYCSPIFLKVERMIDKTVAGIIACKLAGKITSDTNHFRQCRFIFIDRKRNHLD